MITWHIEKNTFHVQVTKENDDDDYAFYLIYNAQVKEKIWYSHSPTASFQLEKSGVYSIQAFRKKSFDKTCCEITNTEPIYYYISGWCPYYKIEEMEMTNICNLSCPNCGNSTTTYRKGFIEDATVLATLQWTMPGQTLNYHRVGEPLLHKELEKYVEWGCSVGIKPVISTNGILLTDEKLKNLYAAGLRHLVITLHTLESLDAFYRCCNYFIEQHKRLVNFSKRFSERDDNGIIYIQGKVLDFPDSEEQGKLVRDRIRSINDIYSEYITWSPIHDWAGNASNAEKVKTINPVDVRKNCYFIKNRIINVRWDGSIVGCCFDFNNENEVGNIRDYTHIDCNINGFSLCKSCSNNWAIAR